MICNNSILTIREKISLRLFKTFRHISLFYSCSFRHALMCASVLIFSCRYFIVFCSLPLHLFQFFHPSVSFRAVSSRERHTTRLRRVLSAPCGASNSGTDFFSLAPAPLLRLSRTLLRLSLPFTLFHATAEGLSLPPNAPLRYPPSYLLEALT